MNVIIVMRNGILDTPVIVKHDETASAVFQSIAEDLLGDDAQEVNFMDDNAVDSVNYLLEGTGIDVVWYQGLEINKFKN